MLYPQHGMDIQLLSDVGIRSIQMGQSPNVSGGRWKSFSSCTILDRLIIYRECLGYLDVTTLRPFYNVRLYWLEDHPINWSLQYIRFGQICQAPWSKSKGYQERETMGYQEQGNDDTRIWKQFTDPYQKNTTPTILLKDKSNKLFDIREPICLSKTYQKFYVVISLISFRQLMCMGWVRLVLCTNNIWVDLLTTACH